MNQILIHLIPKKNWRSKINNHNSESSLSVYHNPVSYCLHLTDEDNEVTQLISKRMRVLAFLYWPPSPCLPPGASFFRVLCDKYY